MLKSSENLERETDKLGFLTPCHQPLLPPFVSGKLHVESRRH